MADFGAEFRFLEGVAFLFPDNALLCAVCMAAANDDDDDDDDAFACLVSVSCFFLRAAVRARLTVTSAAADASRMGARIATKHGPPRNETCSSMV